MILLTPCICSLPSWRTLQRKLFLRLRQYQNIWINHGFLIFVKSAPERFKREPIEGNLNTYRIARDIRHSKKTSWRNYVFKHRLNLYQIGSANWGERNPVTQLVISLSMIEKSHLTVTLLMHWQITSLIIVPLLSAQLQSLSWKAES